MRETPAHSARTGGRPRSGVGLAPSRIRAASSRTSQPAPVAISPAPSFLLRHSIDYLLDCLNRFHHSLPLAVHRLQERVNLPRVGVHPVALNKLVLARASDQMFFLFPSELGEELTRRKGRLVEVFGLRMVVGDYLVFRNRFGDL